MLPLRFLRNRGFAAGSASAFFMTGSIFGGALMVTQYFQLGLGHSGLATGVRLLPWTVTPIFISPLAGALSDRIGRRPVIVGGLSLQALGFAWIAMRASTHLSLFEWLLVLFVAGIGVSMALPAVPTAILNSVEPGEMGTASGINSMMQRFGAVFAVAIATSAFTAYGQIGSPATVTDGFRPAIAASAALSLLGALSAVLLKARSRKKAEVEAAVSVAA